MIEIGRFSPFFIGHEGSQGEQRYSSTLSMTSAFQMGVGDQPNAPAASTSGKDSLPIVQKSGWAPGPVWTGGKSRPYRDSIPERPAHSQSLYRLSYWPRSDGNNQLHFTPFCTWNSEVVSRILEILCIPVLIVIILRAPSSFYTSCDETGFNATSRVTQQSNTTPIVYMQPVNTVVVIRQRQCVSVCLCMCLNTTKFIT